MQFDLHCRHTISSIVIGHSETAVSHCRPINYSASYRGMCSIEGIEGDPSHRILSSRTNGEIHERHAEFIRC